MAVVGIKKEPNDEKFYDLAVPIWRKVKDEYHSYKSGRPELLEDFQLPVSLPSNAEFYGIQSFDMHSVDQYPSGPTDCFVINPHLVTEICENMPENCDNEKCEHHATCKTNNVVVLDNLWFD